MEQIARAEMHQPTQSNMRDLPAGATRKFWSWACDEGSGTRPLYLDGVIADATVKIDGIAASAASAIAMAGTKVLMAPTALMMVHNPLTVAIGDSGEMQKAIAMLGEVKESIINAYEIKTGLSRVRLSHLMDAETWLNANKAIEMGFADGILEDTKRGHPEAITFAFSRRAVTNSLMSKLIPKPESKVNTGISIEAAMQNLQARKYI